MPAPILKLIAVLGTLAASPAAGQDLPFVPLGAPEDSIVPILDPVLRLPVIRATEAFAVYVETLWPDPDGDARVWRPTTGAARETLAAVLAEADAGPLSPGRASQRQLAEWRAASLTGAEAAWGLSAALDRADLAVALERQLAANAFLFGNYLPDTDFAAVSGAAGSAREAAIGWALDEARAAGDLGDATRAAVLAGRAFRWAQTLLQGPAARAAVRPMRDRAARDRLDALMRDLRGVTAVEDYIHAYGAPAGQEDRILADFSAALERISAGVTALHDGGVDVGGLILPRPLGVELVQALLAPDEALILIVPDDLNYAVFALNRDRMVWYRTESYRLDIDALARDMLSGITAWRTRSAVPLPGTAAPDRPRRAMLDAAHALHAEMLAPAAGVTAGRRRLLIAAAGTPAQYPWALLLVSPAAEGTEFAGMDWLVRHHAPLVLPAVEMLAARPAGRPAGGLSYLGFGAPDFAAARGWAERAWGAPVAGLMPLPEAAEEVADVGALYLRRLVLTGAEASELRLEEMSRAGTLAGYDVIHFATHGLIWGDHPEVTEGLVALTAAPAWNGLREISVAGMFPEVPDGALIETEIRRLALHPALVILSACKTAGGPEVEWEGVTGLAAAFLDAGAERVLATHWPVNSRAAVEIVTAMMLRDPALADPAGALQAAILAQIAAGGGRADPAWWGPFSLIGAP